LRHQESGVLSNIGLTFGYFSLVSSSTLVIAQGSKFAHPGTPPSQMGYFVGRFVNLVSFLSYLDLSSYLVPHTIWRQAVSAAQVNNCIVQFHAHRVISLLSCPDTDEQAKCLSASVGDISTGLRDFLEDLVGEVTSAVVDTDVCSHGDPAGDLCCALIADNGSAASVDDISAGLRDFLDDVTNKITPTCVHTDPLEKPVEWISTRLLSYRSFLSMEEDFQGFHAMLQSGGEQIFDSVERGGSTARGTAIWPIHDVDLIAYMKCCGAGMTDTFDHVMGALCCGSSSVVRVAANDCIYAVSLADDDQHPEEFRRFVVRWQRHSFGICFGESWDPSHTTFDVVPVWRKDDRLYLTSRFSHLQEADPRSISTLQSEITDNIDGLRAAIRLFKYWNKRNIIHESAPFASFELEAAITLFWTHDQERLCEASCAKRVVMIFEKLYHVLGAQFRIPGLVADEGAYVVLGRGNASWTAAEVRKLLMNAWAAVSGTFYREGADGGTCDDVDLTIGVWRSVFEGTVLPNCRIKTEDATNHKIRTQEVIVVDGLSPLLCALLDDRNIEYIDKLVKEKAADISAVDPKGRTPLYYAAEKGRVDAIVLLLQYGANPLAVGDSRKGYDSLHRAVMSRCARCVELLLNHGSGKLLGPEETRDRLALALGIAMNYPDEDIVVLLLKQGADLSHRAYSRDRNALQRLFGASTTISSALMETVLSYEPQVDEHILVLATVRGDSALLEQILSYCRAKGVLTYVWLTASIKMAVRLGYDDTVKWILKKYGSLITDAIGFECAVLFDLMASAACAKGFTEVASALLTFSPACGPSTVLWCVVQGHVGALKVVLEIGQLWSRPAVRDCFAVHAAALRRDMQWAAAYLVTFVVRHVDLEELVDYLMKREDDNVICDDSEVGRWPIMLVTLLVDEALHNRAIEFLELADRRGLCVLGFCEQHPWTGSLSVCGMCDMIHCLCVECVHIGNIGSEHVWEVLNGPSNVALYDYIMDNKDNKETLMRLGCMKRDEELLGTPSE
jgi:ankyrin repeat protein